jgi:hypothetical protein
MTEIKAKPKEVIVGSGWSYLPFEDWGNFQDILEEYAISMKKRQIACETVLSNFGKSRDNDRILDWECLRAEFPDILISSDRDNIFLTIPKKIIKYLPSPESYTRVRRKLNAKGLFLPESYSTIVRRMKRQKAIRQYFSDEKYKKQVREETKIGYANPWGNKEINGFREARAVF